MISDFSEKQMSYPGISQENLHKLKCLIGLQLEVIRVLNLLPVAARTWRGVESL